MNRIASLILLAVLFGCGERTAMPDPSDPGAAPSRAAETRELDGGASDDSARSTDPAAPAEATIGGIELRTRSVIDGKLALLIPADFTKMDDEMLRVKYPAERRPTLVFTNERGTINVAINHTTNRMPKEGLSDFHQHIEQVFRKLYPSADWFESKMADINGREWLMLDLRTPAIDTQIRNIIVATSLEGRALMVSFNVTSELEPEWLEAGRAIVGSLHVEGP